LRERYRDAHLRVSAAGIVDGVIGGARRRCSALSDDASFAWPGWDPDALKAAVVAADRPTVSHGGDRGVRRRSTPTRQPRTSTTATAGAASAHQTIATADYPRFKSLGDRLAATAAHPDQTI
jgi:hypothetical protein